MSVFNQEEKQLTDIEEQTVRAEAYDEIFGTGKKTNEGEKVLSEKEASVNPPLAEADPDEKVTLSLEDEREKLFDEINKKLEAIELLNQTVSSMSHRLKQAEQRIGGINNRLTEVKESKKSPELLDQTKSQPAPTKQQIEQAAQDDIAWNNLKESFPDWAVAIEKKISDNKGNFVTKEEIADLRNQLTETKEERAKKVISDHVEPSSSEMDINIRLLNIIHPDWKSVSDSNEFHSWLKRQNVAILDKAQNSPLAEDAIEVLNLFKKETAKTNESTNEIEDLKLKRKERLKSSVNEKTTHTEIKTKAEADLSEIELRQKAAAEIFGK